jgi:hypothetical protein
MEVLTLDSKMDFHEQFHMMAHHYYSPLVPSLQATGPNMPWPEMIGGTANETEMIQRAGPNNGEFHVVSLNGNINYNL